MKNQALFSSKDKSKNLKCRLLQFLFGTLRVKNMFIHSFYSLPVQEHGLFPWGGSLQSLASACKWRPTNMQYLTYPKVLKYWDT